MARRLLKDSYPDRTVRMRYDFSETFLEHATHDAFPLLPGHANDRPMVGAENDVTTVMRRGPLVVRLHVTNGALAAA
jgi:hypothetical protein